MSELETFWAKLYRQRLKESGWDEEDILPELEDFRRRAAATEDPQTLIYGRCICRCHALNITVNAWLKKCPLCQCGNPNYTGPREVPVKRKKVKPVMTNEEKIREDERNRMNAEQGCKSLVRWGCGCMVVIGLFLVIVIFVLAEFLIK